jgi:phage FluMu gp28-like protein
MRDSTQHGLPCHPSSINQVRRERSSASKSSRLAAERGDIEYEYVKSVAGWSPKYIPEALLREAATRMQDRFLFGSDYPFIIPQRWLRDFDALDYFKPEVKEKILWKNGQKLLAHTAVGQMHFST